MRSRLSAEVISKNGNGAHTVLAYPFWLICWQKPTANILLSQILDCNYTWKKIRDFHVYTTKTLEWEYIFENGLWQQKTSANSVGHFEYFFTVLYKQLGLAYIICLSDFLANLTTGSLSSKLVSPALFRRKPRYEKLCSASYWLSQTVDRIYKVECTCLFVSCKNKQFFLCRSKHARYRARRNQNDNPSTRIWFKANWDQGY